MTTVRCLTTRLNDTAEHRQRRGGDLHAMGRRSATSATFAVVGTFLGIVAVGAATARAEVILVGQTDDFNVAGSLQEWSGGAILTNIASGGPDGSRYLQISPGVNQKVGAYNVSQWAGDYVTAGITGIGMDVRNDGPADIALRLLLIRGLDEYAAIAPLLLPAGSGWQHHVFGLSSGDLTQVAGTNGLDFVLSSVDRLLLHHDPDPPNATGGSNPAASANIGIDNVTAVAEPSTLVLLAVAALCVAVIQRRGTVS